MSSAIRNPKSTIQNIFLVGFMACGKSTVGRALAELLQVSFVDLDEKIVAAAGCTIAEMIAQQGEAAFRQLETDSLRNAAAAEPSVIALGGGAFIQAINRDVISQAGLSVWLDAPFALCWERIQRDAVVRPLAATEAEAKARFQQRTAIYQQAQIHIPITNELGPDATAREILIRLEGL